MTLFAGGQASITFLMVVKKDLKSQIVGSIAYYQEPFSTEWIDR